MHGVMAMVFASLIWIPDQVVAETGQKVPGRKTRIYTVFNSGVVTGAAYSVYHPEVKIMENGDVMELLREKCGEVEFVVESGSGDGGNVVERIRDQKENIDGVLCFGTVPDGLVELDLPVIAVFRLWGQWFPLSHHHDDFEGKKVLTSCLPVLPDKDPALYESRIDDIAGKIKLIDVIVRMEGLRVLVITDKPPLGVWEPYDFQIVTGRDVPQRSEAARMESDEAQVEKSRKEYEQVFVDHLEETFGAYLVPIPQNELVERTRVQDEAEAEKVAEKWMAGASGIRGTNKAQIVRSAKLYLAMKALMEENDCDAIATEGYGSFPGRYSVLPSQGLPSSQLLTDGVVAVGETLLNSLITQQLGLFITGSTGQDGDYFIDFLNDIAITAHCEAPFNPYGDGPNSPYIIRNLPFFEQENTAGAVVQVNYPIGVTVTVAKIDMNNRKLALFTGETVSGENLFPYWNDLLCRTKVAIRTNARALHENRDWNTFGHHRVTFFGDYRQEFSDLGTLIGFEVVECDRLR